MAWSPGATAKTCCSCGAGFQFASPAWFALTMQLPVPWKVTEVPATVHTPVAAASIVNATGRPEVAAAATTYGVPPTVAAAGAVEVNAMVCVPRATAKLCCTCGAGSHPASPAWSALITQVPAPWKLTVEPVIEHTAPALASIANVTGRPEVAV